MDRNLAFPTNKTKGGKPSAKKSSEGPTRDLENWRLGDLETSEQESRIQKDKAKDGTPSARKASETPFFRFGDWEN